MEEAGLNETGAKTKTALSAKERVRKHREALRASGLRPVTRWVPELRKPEVLMEYQRQRTVLAERIRANPEEEAEYWREAEALHAEAEEGWVLRRGDICIVASPSEFAKPRPLVIVQSEPLVDETMTYVPISSDLQRLPKVRVPIFPTMRNGLLKESELMVDRIQTATLGRFGPTIGRIDNGTMSKVEAALLMHLGLVD